MSATILIVDDELSQLRMLEYTLEQKLGYRVIATQSGEEAIQRILSDKHPEIDLLLLDLCMPGTHGMQVLWKIREQKPYLPIIILTQYGDDEHASQAIQAGADDFLTKPVALTRLRLSVQNALKAQRMGHMIARLQRKLTDRVAFSDIIGKSQLIKEVLAQAEQATTSKLPLWIKGEHGTGKELLARAIHGNGYRSGKPFICIDCKDFIEPTAATVPLGQEKLSGHPHYILAKLQEADHGTLFFKEIGQLPPLLQKQLLEILHEDQINASHIFARIICSASEETDTLIAQKHFDRALYEKLSSITLSLPNLRERKEDISHLARHFTRLYAATESKYIEGVTQEGLDILLANAWNGNVRQLAHLIWRAVMLCKRDYIDMAEIRLAQKQSMPESLEHENITEMAPTLLDMEGRLKKLKLIEEEVIRFALRHSGGCMTRAARGLGIGRSTLYRRINELAIDIHISRANHTTRPMMKVSSIDRS